MKLLLLCLGLTVVCAYHKGKHDIVKCNLDMSKVESGFVGSLDFGGGLGDTEVRWPPWRVRVLV